MIIDGKKIFHLGIGIPSNDYWLSDFAISVLSVIGDLKKTAPPGYDSSKISILNVKSSILSQSREDIVAKALEDQCDYLLWADSDQIFPGYTARKLLESGKDIIGCNIALKMLPSLPTARRYSETYSSVGEIVYTEPNSTGIEKVWRLGFGIMLVNMEVFKKIEQPFFNITWTKGMGYKGEDWSFCEKVEAAGLDIWIDHDLSKEIYHVGMYRYGLRDIPAKENVKQE